MSKKKLSFSFTFKPPTHLRKAKNLPIEALQPYLHLRLYNNSEETPQLEGILDSGAFGILIPKCHAELINLPELDKKIGYGAGGKLNLRNTKLGIKIWRGSRIEDLGYIDATIEMDGNLTDILIGRSPLFEDFQIIFEMFNKKFKLIPKEEDVKKTSFTKKKNINKKKY